ncbi:MAG: 1-(5-phosphoribosyl)-5-[(5-phosphoribosylamino)methylideneamino]imidazole-4-carboxamide isomerase [Thermoleophilia bacterium]|nr:1-(5-phosphoribosyl)-5-[(5-phosphoribosylamino)methylideneamino]imidazole-4-carboxamide isomerase [Thermoleophilia bacterium]
MIEVYPAIDLRDGAAVRLVQGDFERSTVFNEDPVAQARTFAREGATCLHVVDLDGAQTGNPVHAPIIAQLAATFPGMVQLGGGLRDRAAVETGIATGVDRLVVGTAVIEDEEFLAWATGRLGDRLVVALDARDGMVATHGWTHMSDRTAVDVAADLVRTGVRHLLYTDIGRDGTLAGPNLEALRRVSQAAPPLTILASGGISSLDDLTAIAELRLPNIRGVIVGRALYEGRFGVSDAIATLAATDR